MRKPQKLLFRVAPHNGGVVFATPYQAELVASLYKAIESSKTWGEFREAIPPEEYAKLFESFDDDEEEDPRPKDADPFSGECLPSFCDGDFPLWLQPEMDYLLPREILAKYGTRESTAFNGSYWSIPKENLEAICAELRSLGWELESAPDLEFH